jgi:hypothetical protein
MDRGGVSMEFGPYGRGPRPQPLGSEMEREHEHDVEEQAQKQREAEMVTRHRPRRWRFWRRAEDR